MWRVRTREVNATDACLRAAVLKRIAGNQSGGVTGRELMLGKVEQGNAAMAELSQILQSNPYRSPEVQVDEAESRRVRRSPDQ